MMESDHNNLESWFNKFGATAVIGFIATLLIFGKLLHHVFQFRGLVFGILIVPPVIISGVLGLCLLSVVMSVDSRIAADLESGLESVRTNLINFVFASLMLGLTCMRKTSQHNGWRGIITSFLHEGLPMVMYGQILTWGQSGCCLLVLSIAEILDIPIPPHFATIVPLGLESGEHIVALNYITDPVDVSKRGTKWAHTVLAESEALGLLTVSLLAIVLMSGKQFFIACGAIDQEASHPSRTVRPVAGHGAGQAEAFERSAPKHLQSAFSVDDTEDVSGDQINGNHNDNKNNIASLGSHLSLIALAVFISFGVSFLLQLLEIEIKWTQYLIAGIPVFKLSMIAALVCMQIILARTPFLRFRREWFMRLCGLMLDLLIICALSVAYPDIGSLEGTHYMLCSLFVLVCILWNVFCFLYIAKELFPNYWFTRAITLSGMVVGHSYMGLLMARTLDPYLLSPVPVAFVSKLMLIFIPSTTIKNSILVNLVENQSHWLALVICWLIVATWFFIFESHFRHRFVSSKKSEDDPENDSILRGVKDINDIEYSRLSRGMPSSSNIPSSSDQQRYLHEESTGLEMSEEPDSNNTASTGSRAPRSDLTLTMSSENSSIITAQQMNLIASWLPAAQSDRSWTLKYSLRRDGASMATLMSKCVVRDKYGHPVQTTSVIVIEDSWGYIFGGFLGHAFENKPSYYGNGESFVFSVVPTLQVFRWTQNNSFFVISNSSMLAMGGGADGFAFQLDDELDTGVSNRSGTYENKQLSSSEFFKCLNVEEYFSQ